MNIIPKGSEPANIKKRMDTLFAKLDAAYPDKVICGLQKNHKKWSETVRELYRLLGYPDGDAFLNAYGYTVVRAESGRPKNNHEEVIAELRKRYPDGMPFSKISEIVKENPDLQGALKTMQNNANELYGMGLKEYFNQIGLFGLGDKKSQVDNLIAKLKQRYPEGAALPKNVAKLKEENQDLPLSRLTYIKEIYGSDTKEYLLQIGLISAPAELPREESNETYLQLLKQRYAERNKLPINLTELTNENPDIPVRKLNKYLRENGEKKAEHYYIRNHILQGKETDLMEFTYCMVSFAKAAWELGDKQYAYLAESEEYAAGDMVVAELGYAGWELGEIKEVIRCFGIDAPWPVSQTKKILRKARPDEIASGTPRLTAEEQKTSSSFFDPGRQPVTPVVDWSDAVLEQEDSRKEGDIPGFAPAEEGQFQCKSIVDLRENSSSPWGDSWVPCEFRFRGLLLEVAKLKRYAKQNGIWISAEQVVSDRIREIWVIADEKTMDLIEKFPALKATGLAEHWWRQEVHVMFSESGFAGITKSQFGGYFDRRHDGGDGRWEWEYDMMEPVNVRFTWLQTGGWEHVSYRYPFAQDWNRSNYTREENGLIYVAESKKCD